MYPGAQFPTKAPCCSRFALGRHSRPNSPTQVHVPPADMRECGTSRSVLPSIAKHVLTHIHFADATPMLEQDWRDYQEQLRHGNAHMAAIV